MDPIDRMEDETINETDADLSQVMSMCLMISQTKEITQIDTSSCRLPTKVHPGLYKRCGKTLYVDTSIDALIPDPAPPIQKHTGVPGFPDFPEGWCGEEGLSSWRRVPPNSTNTTQRRQRAEDIQKAHQNMVLRRFKRQPVNVAGLRKRPPRTKAGNEQAAASAKTKPHKCDRRRLIVQQLRHQRDMASLRKSLKSLSCK